MRAIASYLHEHIFPVEYFPILLRSLHLPIRIFRNTCCASPLCTSSKLASHGRYVAISVTSSPRRVCKVMLADFVTCICYHGKDRDANGVINEM